MDPTSEGRLEPRGKRGEQHINIVAQSRRRAGSDQVGDRVTIEIGHDDRDRAVAGWKLGAREQRARRSRARHGQRN
jgi:hypothetical protein